MIENSRCRALRVHFIGKSKVNWTTCDKYLTVRTKDWRAINLKRDSKRTTNREKRSSSNFLLKTSPFYCLKTESFWTQRWQVRKSSLDFKIRSEDWVWHSARSWWVRVKVTRKVIEKTETLTTSSCFLSHLTNPHWKTFLGLALGCERLRSLWMCSLHLTIIHGRA